MGRCIENAPAHCVHSVLFAGERLIHEMKRESRVVDLYAVRDRKRPGLHPVHFCSVIRDMLPLKGGVDLFRKFEPFGYSAFSVTSQISVVVAVDGQPDVERYIPSLVLSGQRLPVDVTVAD